MSSDTIPDPFYRELSFLSRLNFNRHVLKSKTDKHVMNLSTDKKPRIVSLYIAVAASLLMHLGLIIITHFLPLKQITEPSAIEFQIVEQQDQKAQADNVKNKKKELLKQIVDQPEKPLNDELDENTKHLSAHNQKVKKQTRAIHIGTFQNSANSSSPSAQGSNASPKKTNKIDLKKFLPQLQANKDLQRPIKQLEKDPETLKITPPQKQAQKLASKENEIDTSSHKELPKGIQTGSGESQTPAEQQASQSSDYIKELEPGLETLLSSKEFLYHTYYSHIRSRLDQSWGTKVREKLSSLHRQKRHVASSGDKITRCLVVLDKLGALKQVLIIGKSGLQELDEAVVEAFRLAAPFPNPPHGMIDRDGTIKIRWDFVLLET